MRRFLHSAVIAEIFDSHRVFMFSEQVSNHRTTRSFSSGQQRTTFDTKQIESLLEQARAKQGGRLPEIDAGEAYHHYFLHN